MLLGFKKNASRLLEKIHERMSTEKSGLFFSLAISKEKYMVLRLLGFLEQFMIDSF